MNHLALPHRKNVVRTEDLGPSADAQRHRGPLDRARSAAGRVFGLGAERKHCSESLGSWFRDGIRGAQNALDIESLTQKHHEANQVCEKL